MNGQTLEPSADWTTPEEAAAITTLLRAPAAVVAVFFPLCAIAPPVAWADRTSAAAVAAALRCLGVAIVCVPFLLSSKRYRAGRTVMRAWIVTAAAAASLRSIQLIVSLFPLPLTEWLIAGGVQIALMGVFWIAVFA